jgi:hypothetical protein
MNASNRLIVGLGEANDPNRIALQTVQKWDIPNARKLPKSPAQMKSAYQIHKQGHLSLEVRSLRSEYNCVGLIFGSRRTVIDIEHVNKIFEHDGYKKIDFSKGEQGDIVLYEDTSGPVHVGVLWSHHPISQEWIVLSQWGSDGEYFHQINDTREDWRHKVTLWTERLRLD